MNPKNRWKKLLWIFLLSYTALHLGYSILRYNVFQGAASGDFHRVYEEAQQWRAVFADPVKGGNFHPPFYYILLLGLDRLLGGRQNLVYFFYFIQFLFFPLAIAGLVRAAWIRSERPPWAAYGIAAVLAVNFQPFLETLAEHKVEGIEFFLIGLALLAFRRNRDLLCGGWVMLAANLKYLPALLLVHFALKRAGKVLLGSLIGLGFIGVLLYAAFGPAILSSDSLRYSAKLFLSHKHEGNLPEASVEMQTLSGTVNRWLARPAGSTSFSDYLRFGSYMPVPNPALALGIANALKILAFGGWAFFLRRRWKPREKARVWPFHLLEFSMSLVMILVISQAARVHYAILVLPAFILVGLVLFQYRETFSRLEKGLFGLSYALTAMLLPGGLLNRLPPHPLWGSQHSAIYLWWSLPFYGVVLLGFCVALCHHRLLKKERIHGT